jgi:hypothetical protein
MDLLRFIKLLVSIPFGEKDVLNWDGNFSFRPNKRFFRLFIKPRTIIIQTKSARLSLARATPE